MVDNLSKKEPRRWSLRSRLTIMMILALLLFQVIMMSISMTMGLLPLMRQSVEDLSARIINTAERWSELTPDKQLKYQKDIQQSASLYILNNSRLGASNLSELLYSKKLAEILSQKQQRQVKVWSTNIEGIKYYWMLIKVKRQFIKIGFKHDRLGTNPKAVLTALLTLNVIFSLLTAYLFVGYITRPLTNLLNAAKSLGRGVKTELRHKNNSREIQELYNQFNNMSGEVQSLLDNRNTLLIGISHELRTPITRLTLLLEIARGKLGESALKDCNQVLHEMDAIIAQFLSLGRGITNQECTDIILNDSIQTMIDGFSTERINFKTNKSYPLTIQHDALKRVIVNLIDNALKYSGDKPIDIEIEKNTSTISISVLDRGIGIPEDDKSKILQAFVRVNKSDRTDIKGLGLGLAISHLIIQANGWSLSFTDRVDGGTIARLDIPKLTS